MADANLTPPPPGPQKTPSKHHLLNQQVENDMIDGETILLAALDPNYKPPLLTTKIVEGDLTDMGNNIAACRETSGQALQKSISHEAKVIDEGLAKGGMLDTLNILQGAAKDKFPKGSPDRKKYMINEDLAGASYENTLGLTQSVLTQLTLDPLSDQGVTPDEIAGFSSARDAWILAHKVADDEDKAASALRDDRDTLQKSVNDMRHTIRSAADRKWPHTDPANAGTRKKFALPLDREFNG